MTTNTSMREQIEKDFRGSLIGNMMDKADIPVICDWIATVVEHHSALSNREPYSLPPFLLRPKFDSSLPSYSYLHIEGGVGHGDKGLGGTYKYVIFYSTPIQDSKRAGVSAEKFCEGAGIPYATGDCLSDALMNAKSLIESSSK